jgi:hypothetical protein
MTRATDKPLRRAVSGQTHGELVIEVTREQLRLRPLGRRRGAVVIPWGAVYLRAIEAMIAAERRDRLKGKNKVKRGTRI